MYEVDVSEESRYMKVNILNVSGSGITHYPTNSAVYSRILQSLSNEVHECINTLVRSILWMKTNNMGLL
jgi:hypothetical protein